VLGRDVFIVRVQRPEELVEVERRREGKSGVARGSPPRLAAITLPRYGCDRMPTRQPVFQSPTRSRTTVIAFTALAALSGCGGTSAGTRCGTGTEMVGDECVAANTSGGSAGADGGSLRTLSCANPIAPASTTIDDFEAGISRAWYEFDDKSGTATGPTSIAVTAGAPSSTKGLEFTGTDFTLGPMSFGVGIGKVGACIRLHRRHDYSPWCAG
jgi:hypothetical protein